MTKIYEIVIKNITIKYVDPKKMWFREVFTTYKRQFDSIRYVGKSNFDVKSFDDCETLWDSCANPDHPNNMTDMENISSCVAMQNDAGEIFYVNDMMEIEARRRENYPNISSWYKFPDMETFVNFLAVNPDALQSSNTTTREDGTWTEDEYYEVEVDKYE